MPFILYPPKKKAKRLSDPISVRVEKSLNRRKAFGTYVEPSLPKVPSLDKNISKPGKGKKIND